MPDFTREGSIEFRPRAPGPTPSRGNGPMLVGHPGPHPREEVTAREQQTLEGWPRPRDSGAVIGLRRDGCFGSALARWAGAPNPRPTDHESPSGANSTGSRAQPSELTSLPSDGRYGWCVVNRACLALAGHQICPTPRADASRALRLANQWQGKRRRGARARAEHGPLAHAEARHPAAGGPAGDGLLTAPNVPTGHPHPAYPLGKRRANNQDLGRRSLLHCVDAVGDHCDELVDFGGRDAEGRGEAEDVVASVDYRAAVPGELVELGHAVLVEWLA